jgi:hypothetical protein
VRQHRPIKRPIDRLKDPLAGRAPATSSLNVSCASDNHALVSPATHFRPLKRMAIAISTPWRMPLPILPERVGDASRVLRLLIAT